MGVEGSRQMRDLGIVRFEDNYLGPISMDCTIFAQNGWWRHDPRGPITTI